MTEGARVTLSFRKFRCIALSLSRLRRQLPLGGKSHRLKNTTKKISLVVFVFSPLKLQSRSSSFSWSALVYQPAGLNKFRCRKPLSFLDVCVYAFGRQSGLIKKEEPKLLFYIIELFFLIVFIDDINILLIAPHSLLIAL